MLNKRNFDQVYDKNFKKYISRIELLPKLKNEKKRNYSKRTLQCRIK